MKRKYWIIGISLFVFVCLCASLSQAFSTPGGTYTTLKGAIATATHHAGTTPSVPATAIPSPTARPAPTTPPPPATAIPHPPTAVPALFLTITCASATDKVSGQVCVHTVPGAALTITVAYCSGYDATSASLQGTVYADGGGNYVWGWKPDTTCHGAATADVIASWHGQSVEATRAFTVV